MDRVSVSRFVHYLNTYFELVGLTDNIKCAQIAVTLLKNSAFIWYQTQGIMAVHGWLRLRNAIMHYFKPADCTFKTQLALAKWQQRGSVTDYIVGFAERYTACADVDANEAFFQFLDGLQPSV